MYCSATFLLGPFHWMHAKLDPKEEKNKDQTECPGQTTLLITLICPSIMHTDSFKKMTYKYLHKKSDWYQMPRLE